MAKITTTSNAALDLEPDGTGDINLTPGTNGDVNIPANKGLTFASDTEKIESNDTDLTINSGGDIDLTATTDINIPQDVGLTFGNDGEKIEGNATKLDIAAAEIDFSIEAGGDINIGTDIGLTFGDDGEKIEGDGTDLTVSSSGNFTVDATGDIILDAGGADVTLKDGGTTYGSLKQASGHLVIQPTSSKEIILNDEGGDAALTIDTDGDIQIANNIDTGTFNGTIGSSATFPTGGHIIQIGTVLNWSGSDDLWTENSMASTDFAGGLTITASNKLLCIAHFLVQLHGDNGNYNRGYLRLTDGTNYSNTYAVNAYLGGDGLANAHGTMVTIYHIFPYTSTTPTVTLQTQCRFTGNNRTVEISGDYSSMQLFEIQA